MKFKTEEERLKDPLASLIPKKLWQGLFQNELKASLVPFMSAVDEATLLDLLNKNQMSDPLDKTRCWFAIALSHPHLSHSSLQKIGDNFSPSEMLSLALQWGNKDYIAFLIQRYKETNCLQTSLLDLKCTALCKTAEEGPLTLFLSLLQELPFEPKDWLLFLAGDIFRAAVAAGQLEILKYLVEQAPEQIQTLIRENHLNVIGEAARQGQLKILKFLREETNPNLKTVMRTHDSKVFSALAAGGQLESLAYFVSQLPQEIPAMLSDAIRAAAQAGQLEVLKYFEQLEPQTVLTSIKTHNSRLWFSVIRAGKLEVLKYLLEKASEENIPPRMLSSFLNTAVEVGQFDIFRYLEQFICSKGIQIQPEIQEIYGIVESAALAGDLEILKYLEQKYSPQEFQYKIQKQFYKVFSQAASGNHLEILQYLITKVPEDKVQAMIKGYNYEAFVEAARRGHLEVLKFLVEKAPQEVLNMVKAADQAPHRTHTAFRVAAESGQLEVLKYLVATAPQEAQAMVQSLNYSAFRQAAQRGHLEVLKFLISLAPENRLAMINEIRAEGLVHLEVVKYLIELVPPEQLRTLIQTQDYRPFFMIARIGDLKLFKCLKELVPQAFENANRMQRILEAADPQIKLYLLEDTLIFAHAEQHQQEYQLYVHPLVKQKLTALKAQKQAFEAAHPNGVFDVSAEEAQYLFYVLRNLIRRNDPNCLDEMHLLLSLPKLKNLVPQAANELVRLALNLNNGRAAALLLRLPQVRALAEQNNYYRDEIHAGFDLERLAQDRESAMQALTSGEQKRLEAAIARYQPLLEQKGVAVVMEELKTLLRTRYLLHPAQIFIDEAQNKVLKLPLEWEEFLKLKLEGPQKQAALEAYYKNKDHSALRYLSKPNFWMHEQASYVYVSENRQERWSTFEEYQPLISMLFLAAQDEESPPIEQFSIETRIEHFIAELALIGRSHNWDKSKVKTDAQGNPLLDEEHNPILEEYDDLEADRPTCYSGVKRRLFQSLPGHALFRVLTAEHIKAELRDFVRAHFSSLINETNRKKFKEAWEALLEGDQAGISPLKALDLSEAQQKEFADSLEKKYGRQFTEDPLLIKEVQDAFYLNPNIEDCHFIRFAYAQPELLLDDTEQKPRQIHIKQPSLNAALQLRVWSGFIFSLGLIAVALALTLLGIPGIVLACIGTAALLGGLGLFAKTFYPQKAEVIEAVEAPVA